MKECIFHSVKHINGYLKYLCHESESSEKLPLLIYLHGAGSRGNELSMMAHVGPIARAECKLLAPCIMIAPQCHATTWFELFEVLIEFIDVYRCDPRVDIERVYLCGSSMGAYTAWNVACVRPEWFSALVPVCGGGMPWLAGQLKSIPVWAFHGMQDDTVAVEESVRMVAAVNKNGGDAKLTLYPNADHDAWTPAYSDDEMWNWLFLQKKS